MSYKKLNDKSNKIIFICFIIIATLLFLMIKNLRAISIKEYNNNTLIKVGDL